MDELMSMMNQLAAGETSQAAQSLQDIMQESPVPVIVGLILGLVICFFGLKLIRILAAITGICIGAAAGVALSFVFGLQGTAVIGAAAVGAVLFACLGSILRRVGGFLFMLLLTAGALEIILTPETLPVHLVCLGVALVVAIVTAVLMDPIIIVISSLGGGVLSGTAAVALTGLDLNVFVTYAAWIVFAVLGVIVQFLMKSREVGKKEKRYSEAVKEEKSVETEVEKARMLLDDDFADATDAEEAPVEQEEADEQEEPEKKDSEENK